MKKVLNLVITISIIIAISAIVLYLQVFSKSAKENIKKQEQALIKTEKTNQEINEFDEKINIQDEKAKNYIEQTETITEESIITAINYIEENSQKSIEELNEEIILNIAYNGAYLENLKKYSSLQENEIFNLGTKSKEYAKEALQALPDKQSIENTEIIPEENINANVTETKNIEEAAEPETIEIDTKVASKEKTENKKIEIKEILNQINTDRQGILEKLKQSMNK